MGIILPIRTSFIKLTGQNETLTCINPPPPAPTQSVRQSVKLPVKIVNCELINESFLLRFVTSINFPFAIQSSNVSMKKIHAATVLPSMIHQDPSRTVATMIFSTVAGRSRPIRVNTSDLNSTTISIWSGMVPVVLIVFTFAVWMINHLMIREASQSHDYVDPRTERATIHMHMMH